MMFKQKPSIKMKYIYNYHLHEEIMLLGAPVCISVCRYAVCVYYNSKSNEQILKNSFMWVGHDQRKKYLNFGEVPHHILDTKCHCGLAGNTLV